MFFTYSCFFFVPERKRSVELCKRDGIKLVYRINNTRYSFQKNKLHFKLKTTIYRPHTFELKSISKYQLFFFGRALKIYDLDTLP